MKHNVTYVTVTSPPHHRYVWLHRRIHGLYIGMASPCGTDFTIRRTTTWDVSNTGARPITSASAWYNPATGMYARGASVYGPYGGYGRAAAYNPRTGAYAWGQAAWGPYGAAASGGFYSPRTGAWGAGRCAPSP